MPSGYFQAKADLQMGNVIKSYYNTKPEVTFNYLQDPHTSHEKSNWKIPSFTKLDLHQDETSVTKYETATPKINSNQSDTIPRQNIERPHLPQFGAEILPPVQQHIGRQIGDLDSTAVNCPKED